MGNCDREVAKHLCDLIGRISVSVTGVLAEKRDRLLAIKDTDCQWRPSQTVPVKVVRCGDEGPNSVALRGKISQVVDILHVVKNEEAVCRIC